MNKGYSNGMIKGCLNKGYFGGIVKGCLVYFCIMSVIILCFISAYVGLSYNLLLGVLLLTFFNLLGLYVMFRILCFERGIF